MRQNHSQFASFVVLALALFTQSSALFAQEAPAEGEKPKVAQSRIDHVTVYPDSALITREVEVPDGAGVTEIVVSPLPPRVIENSLYSEGSDGLRVLTTRFRSRVVKEDTRKEVRQIQAELKKLEMESQKIQSELKSIEQNLQMLSKLENFTSVTTISATEKAVLNAQAVMDLTKYVMEQRNEKHQQQVELQQKLQSIQEQLNFWQSKMQEIAAGTNRTERDAVIVVDRTAGKGGKVRLNYLVDAVTWRPHYKLRAGKANDPVQVDYLAALLQQTGEDWAGVRLTLSTAQPMLNAAPPELKKLEVAVMSMASVPGGGKAGFGTGPAQVPFDPQQNVRLEEKARELRQQAQTYSRQKDIANTEKAINEAAAFEQTKELMTSRDELRDAMKKLAKLPDYQDGPSVTFHLAPQLTVPSRADEQVIEVAKLNLTPSYYYKAVPVLSSGVYRLANLTNKSDHVLLPGEATMYEGTDFVGRMRMPLVAIGEQFTAGFGVDPQLQVQRQLVDKSRSTQGGNQVLQYEYRILMHSYKKEPVKMQVWDRLPVAETESAAVTVVKSNPELSTDPIYLREQRPSNLLRWDVIVQPEMNGQNALTISYTFKIELDREKVISRLITK